MSTPTATPIHERVEARGRISSLRQSAKQLARSPRPEAREEARRSNTEADATERYYMESEDTQ